MKSREIFSFILIYFAFVTISSSSQTVETTVKNETIAHSEENKSQLVNFTNSTKIPKELSTATTAPETGKLKNVTKVEGNLNNSETSNITKNTTATATATVSPVKLPTKTTNSTTSPQRIFTESGVIAVENTTLSTTSRPTTNSTGIPTTATTTTTNSTSSSTSTTTTTTTTTSSRTTTTTTTPKPKKPTIVFSDEDQIDTLPDDKKLVQKSSLPSNHDVEEPHVQPSKEKPLPFNPHRDFVVPLVTFIFALPIILGITVIGYRKVRDYWSTRHYRRMDFLVDGMYND